MPKTMYIILVFMCYYGKDTGSTDIKLYSHKKHTFRNKKPKEQLNTKIASLSLNLSFKEPFKRFIIIYSLNLPRSYIIQSLFTILYYTKKISKYDTVASFSLTNFHCSVFENSLWSEEVKCNWVAYLPMQWTSTNIFEHNVYIQIIFSLIKAKISQYNLLNVPT